MNTKQGYPDPEDRWNKNFNKKPKASADGWGHKKDLPPELPADRSGTRKPFNLGRNLKLSDFDLKDFSADELNKTLDFLKNPPNPDDLRENP